MTMIASGSGFACFLSADRIAIARAHRIAMTMVRMTATARVALPPALVLSIMSSGGGGSGSGGGGGFLDHGKRIVVVFSSVSKLRGDPRCSVERAPVGSCRQVAART